MRKVGLAVKKWAKARHIKDAKLGTFSSYSTLPTPGCCSRWRSLRLTSVRRVCLAFVPQRTSSLSSTTSRRSDPASSPASRTRGCATYACQLLPRAGCCARAACNAAHAVSIAAVARCLCQLYKKETGKECIDRTVGDDHVLFIDDVEWVQGYMVRGWRARVALHRHSR